jgi:hypothetical protein
MDPRQSHVLSWVLILLIVLALVPLVWMIGWGWVVWACRPVTWAA